MSFRSSEEWILFGNKLKLKPKVDTFQVHPYERPKTRNLTRRTKQPLTLSSDMLSFHA